MLNKSQLSRTLASRAHKTVFLKSQPSTAIDTKFFLTTQAPIFPKESSAKISLPQPSAHSYGATSFLGGSFQLGVEGKKILESL